MNEKEIVMDMVEQARRKYRCVINQPIRYRKEHGLKVAEAELVQIECLAIRLGYIKSGTI